MSEKINNNSQPDAQTELNKRSADLEGTISSGESPTKKVKLFFSKRIWIAILSFLALTIIGGVIEFTVQTPISKYIEKVTGPRMRTLKTQLAQGNHEFVYNNIKDKFYNEPDNEKYKELYLKSASGSLRDLLKEKEWQKASEFLSTAITGTPISDEFRRNLRAVYIAGQPERFQLFKQSERGPDAGARLNALWQEIELMASKEPEAPVIQYEAGRTLAELDWVAQRYNLYSLDYFEKAIKLDPQIKDQEIIYNVLDQTLEQSAREAIITKARSLIQTYYLEKYLPILQDMLKPYPFEKEQITELPENWRKRINAFVILSDSQKLEPADEFRFYLMTIAHFSGKNKKNMKYLAQAKLYFKNLVKTKKFKTMRNLAELPKIVPTSVLSNGRRDQAFRETWPLISGTLAPIFAGYCHERFFYKPKSYLSRNCYQLLKKIKKLTPREKKTAKP